MSSFQLKCIAILAMLTDHIGAVFVPENTLCYMMMRAIGRISFPIFCFLIVEGFYHTHNLRRYEGRLLLFACLSEIPFNLAFYRRIFFWQHQNVFFTLWIGLGTIFLLQKVSDQIELPMLQKRMLQGFIFITAGLCAYGIHSDYDFVGIFMIVAFYFFRKEHKRLFFSLCIICLCFFEVQEFFALFALIPIFCYNGKKGLSLQYFFYLFYPFHLLLIYGLEQWIPCNL